MRVIVSDQHHSGDDTEDCCLQRALEEMRRLDEILTLESCKEKEIRLERKVLQAKLWQDLLVETIKLFFFAEIYNLSVIWPLEYVYIYIYISPSQDNYQEHSECALEALNTKQFLALEAHAGMYTDAQKKCYKLQIRK